MRQAEQVLGTTADRRPEVAREVLDRVLNIPLWLTLITGATGAILGTLMVQYLDVAVTPGVDWMEIVLQVAIAAAITLATSLYSRPGIPS